jgi:5-methylcytosine-specific restriction endonuclease McrA
MDEFVYSHLDLYLLAFPRLSVSKYVLIKELWGQDSDPFPKPWVEGKRLMEITEQKNYDRRVRELKDEMGFDIESASNNSKHCYRLKSVSRTTSHIRINVTTKIKEELFINYNNQCNFCGDPGTKKIQADHRIPVIRGGKNNIENLQPLCSHCNIIKRNSCSGCEDNCQNCSLAYPEKYSSKDLNWDYSI